jgi:hypothetical protein
MLGFSAYSRRGPQGAAVDSKAKLSENLISIPANGGGTDIPCPSFN